MTQQGVPIKVQQRFIHSDSVAADAWQAAEDSDSNNKDNNVYNIQILAGAEGNTEKLCPEVV